MRRAFRIFLLALGLLAAGLALGTAAGDPALYPHRGGDGVRVHVVDHGYHAGLIVATPDLRAAALRLGRTEPELAHVLRAVAQDHPHADWLEFGWGDAGFYQGARTMEDVTLSLVLRALLVPSPSVLHVVAGRGDPARAFPRAEGIALDLAPEGMTRLARRLAQTFAPGPGGTPEPRGAALYGEGAFYAARPSYHALATCNHWLAGLLRAAGVPVSWSWSATSAGLMTELGWRTRPPGMGYLYTPNPSP